MIHYYMHTVFYQQLIVSIFTHSLNVIISSQSATLHHRVKRIKIIVLIDQLFQSWQSVQ